MKPSVYIETSIISYLASRPSRDVVHAARQQITHVWWERRSKFALFASDLVVREASAGDLKAADKRLAALDNIPLLHVSTDAAVLTDELLRLGGLPKKAAADALHIAVAAVHGVDYLLT